MEAPLLWHYSAVTVRDRSKQGFWYQVGRPFRAISRALDASDLFSGVAMIGRAIVWVGRGLGKLLSAIFDPW